MTLLIDSFPGILAIYLVDTIKRQKVPTYHNFFFENEELTANSYIARLKSSMSLKYKKSRYTNFGQKRLKTYLSPVFSEDSPFSKGVGIEELYTHFYLFFFLRTIFLLRMKVLLTSIPPDVKQ